MTTEQRALCESICTKEPLTNGFAGAPTAPCPNDENCADWLCSDADLFWMPTETCTHAFTDYLTCLDSQPDEAYECTNYGPILSVGCENEAATMWAVCW